MSALSLARTVRFTPYRRGAGPSFTLRLFWTGRVGEYGKNVIAYRLVSEGRVLFEGQDFQGHCDADSNEAVEGIMGFLTLQPGDTDEEYFASYTAEQLAFAAAHAEQLSSEVDFRFRCPECGSSLNDDGECGRHGHPRDVRRREEQLRLSAVHSHTTTGFCPICITPGGGCSFAG